MFALALEPLSASQRGAVPPPGQPIFRTSSTLATIDAVVTDDEGRPVTDLTRDDFEVKVSGRRQDFQQAVFVRADFAPYTARLLPATPVAGAPSSPRPTTAGQNASAILKASATGTGRYHADHGVRRGRSEPVVRKHVCRPARADSTSSPRLRRGDLVAIVRTASGVGALQQFTTDKRLLRLTVDRVVGFQEPERGGVVRSRDADHRRPGRRPGRIDGEDRQAPPGDDGTGSLGAIRFVAEGIHYLPGRKYIVLLSEGFAEMFKERIEGGRLWNALTNMLDSANRAGVVLYTIDARGLQTTGLTAENPLIRDWGVGGGSADSRSARRLRPRKAEDRNNEPSTARNRCSSSQSTGGLAIMNTNDLGKAIDRVLADQRGYYLGYTVPPDSPLRGWNQGGVHISVKRPHMHVRSRQGFFGPASPRDAAKPMTDPLLIAALSPFTNADISARLTSDFWHDGTKPSVQSMFFIDANDIAFSLTDTGRRIARMDLGLFAVADNGQITAFSRRSISMDLTADRYNDALKHGLVYRSRLFVHRPGAYQVRAAIATSRPDAQGPARSFWRSLKSARASLRCQACC